MYGWIDHPDNYGPLTRPENLEEPKYLLSAVVLHKWPEALEYAVRGWAKVGTQKLVEATYAYVVQTTRGVLSRKELALRLLEVLPEASEVDILAVQRVLKVALGVTTCDLGLVVLSYIPIGGAPPPPRPKGAIYEIKREWTIYISRNNQGPTVYDGETMCVIPMSSREPLHPLYRAYLENYKIATENIPAPTDLCVVHKRVKLQCVDLAHFW